MRIGIDASCWSNGRGFGRFTRELLGAVAALNTDDEFVLFSDRQTAEQATFPDGWRVVVADTHEAASRAASADGRRSLHDVWVMRKAVQRETLDLMFFPAVYSYFPVAGRMPCLVTFHDVIAETLPHLVFHTRRSRWFWQLKTWLALRRTACLVTVSETSKRGLIETFGVSAERVRVISEAASDAFGPVDRRSAEHARVLERYELQGGRRFLLYVGGISPHKNLDTLIGAFAQIAGEASFEDVRLVLVGDYAGDVFRTCYEELRDQIESLGIVARVQFAGYVPDKDLVHLYAAAQAFVFPSYLEGFGLPVVEAMSCGAVVLASDRGSLPEVLNGAGHLFDPHDTSSLAIGLRRVLSDEGYRRDLAGRGAARARDFSWELSARRAVEIFHEHQAV